jgi:hypothetical protein
MGLDEQLRRAERLARQARTDTCDVARVGDLVVPRVGEFVLSPDYLNLKRLYPRQLTFLKVLFLELDGLTEFDRRTIAQWSTGFELVEGPDGLRRYVGGYGTPPDVLERAQRCRDEGCPWFHEVVMPTGRRASKSLLMALTCLYQLWWFLARPEGPQEFFHVAPTKRLNIAIFSGKKDQARANLWRDIVEIARDAPCFQPFIARKSDDTLLLYSPTQLRDGNRPDPDRASLEVVAREASRTAGRGPASLALFFDEMAYMVPTGASRGADEIFTAAAPATMQFRGFGFIGQVSSPWQRSGRFHDNYQDALRVDTEGTALYPDTLVLQVPSWDLYEDWELTRSGLLTYPEGSPFPSLDDAIITEAQLHRERVDRPDSFGPEYGAQWAQVLNAYLEGRYVTRLFEPWRGQRLTMRSAGQRDIEYHAHVDPSRSGANFAVVVAHAEADDAGVTHVVVDLIKVWRPRDFPPNFEINYVAVEAELFHLIEAFNLRTLTFDQWNSAGAIDHLRARVREAGFWWRTDIDEHTATQHTNWAEAENFKTALINHVVHAPYDELAEQELASLQWDGHQKVHPSPVGPCTTSDTSDCLFVLTHRLLGGLYDPFRALSQTTLHAGYPGGIPTAADEATFDRLRIRGQTNWHAQPHDRPPRPGRARPNPARGWGYQ